MKPCSVNYQIALCFCFTISAGLSAESLSAEDIVFSRDVLPVLSDRCFHCHGPDEGHREVDLRLDLERSAKADLGGYAAIVPGNLEDSEIWNRITSEDENELMPPPDSHRKPLTKKERAAIRAWILAGAQWGKHWSFEKLSRPDVPDTGSHPIDAFVAARLSEQGLQLSDPATPATQLRRLSLDLTGLSPTPADVRAFGDGSEEEWQAAISRLLKSPHHAERMAMWWLDAARYSDSDGFQQDGTRQNWPWRDWVIQQFQHNKSFKDFTIEQFAGDILPDSTDEQKLATCFHRNHMTNGEGGRDPEESRIDYVIDRVNTMGTVWLGLTLGCVQCHSHKFDPISQHDYYALSAFFNSIDENGKAGTGARPYLKYQSPFAEERFLETSKFVGKCQEQETEERIAAELRFDDWLEKLKSNPPSEYRAWWTPPPSVSSSEGTEFLIESNQIIQTYGRQPRQDDYRIILPIPKGVSRITGWKLEVFPHDSHFQGRFTRGGNGEFSLTSVRMLIRPEGSPAETQLEMSRATADAQRDKSHNSIWDPRYGRIIDTLNDDARDGWSTIGVEELKPHTGVFELKESLPVSSGDRLVVMLRHRSTHGHANISRFRISLATERGETVRRVDGNSPVMELVEHIREKGNASLSKGLRKRLLDQFLLGDDSYQQAASRLKSANSQLAELKKQQSPRNVMVLAEMEKPRETHVLVRGVWDAKGDVVQRSVLPSVLAWPTEKTATRLDLANWLVDSDNPLTARVVANHMWQIMFGQGLVRTTEDFGLQGELPTHPKLLDWLAVELIESDWDLQYLLRLIATSQTYRQSSTASPELHELDPTNRLLARAPRFRLPAWMIRDNVLQVSGLLNPAVGGPPVMPYQPPGVWSEITMGRFNYRPSLGPSQYRRTVYAFWRRSSAPAFLFDSAQRRVCEVGVRRTNTPLHALTLMNDVTMLEASRALADSIVRTSMDQRTGNWHINAQQLAMRILSRELKANELNHLRDVWSSASKYYRTNIDQAVSYCSVGQQTSPNQKLAPQTAAWMTVTSLLFNLDEAMTRE